MKKILFIKSITKTDAITDKDWQGLKDGVSKAFGSEYQTEVSSFTDLAFLTNGKESKIWHITKGYDIADFDLVVFRRVGYEIEKAISAAYYLKSRSVPFIDHYILTEGKGKLAGSFLRMANDIPVPRTFYSSAEGYKKVFKECPPFNYPFILKDDNGSKGRNNYLVKSYEELIDIVEQSSDLDMISQEFIQNNGDMRVLVLNGKISVVIFRKGKEGSHLNNTSQGGQATLLDPKDLDSHIASDCLKAAKLERLQVAGVDVVIDKISGKHYFLEVNRAPQLATGAFVDEKLFAYANMIDSIMKKIDSVKSKKPVGILGSVEKVKVNNNYVHARIDTGAKTSSIWASNIKIIDDKLHFRLFDESSDYVGCELIMDEFSRTIVASSNGKIEERFKIKLPIVIKGRKVKASFTLADRSAQVYSILIGRNVLRGKFVVDIIKGKPLYNKEHQRTKKLRTILEE